MHTKTPISRTYESTLAATIALLLPIALVRLSVKVSEEGCGEIRCSMRCGFILNGTRYILEHRMHHHEGCVCTRSGALMIMTVFDLHGGQAVELEQLRACFSAVVPPPPSPVVVVVRAKHTRCVSRTEPGLIERPPTNQCSLSLPENTHQDATTTRPSKRFPYTQDHPRAAAGRGTSADRPPRRRRVGVRLQLAAGGRVQGGGRELPIEVRGGWAGAVLRGVVV